MRWRPSRSPTARTARLARRAALRARRARASGELEQQLRRFCRALLLLSFPDIRCPALLACCVSCLASLQASPASCTVQSQPSALHASPAAGGKTKQFSSLAHTLACCRYGAEPSSTDAALMYRLGDVISSMREDFIVVHLAEPCSYCRSYISGSARYHLLAQ